MIPNLDQIAVADAPKQIAPARMASAVMRDCENHRGREGVQARR